MPDGVRVSQSVPTWQARPTHGRRRRYGHRSPTYGRSVGARKNPARVDALAGLVRCSDRSLFLFDGTKRAGSKPGIHHEWRVPSVRFPHGRRKP
jgi:hypothetical protein